MANVLLLVFLLSSMMVFIVVGQTCTNTDDANLEAYEQEGDLVSFLQASGSKLDTGMLERPAMAWKPLSGSGASLAGETSATFKPAPSTEQATSKTIAASALSLYQRLKLVVTRLRGRLREVPSIFWILPVVAVILTIMCFYLLAILSMTDGHSGEEPTLSTAYAAAHSGNYRKAVPASYATSPSITTMPPRYLSSPSVPTATTAPPRYLSSSSPSLPMASGINLARQNSTPSIPKISPQLVMDNIEARFAVNLASLARIQIGHTVDIVGPTREPLLTLVVKDQDTLQLCLKGNATMPRCSVICKPSPSRSCEILGERGIPYGHFTRSISSSFGRSGNVIDVFHHDGPVLKVTESGKFDYTITQPQGQAYALARKNKIDYGVEYFEIRGQPGADMMLVIAVVLADLIFFSPHE